MKKSHQRSMKLAVLPCMIAVALSISGCTFSEINKMQKKAQEDSAHAREKVSALSARKSQALTWLDNQWINPVPVAQVSREKKQTAPACYITQARKGEITLQELGQRITAVCGIPVIITPDAANSTLEGGATRQMTGTLPAPDENGRLPLSSLGSTTMTTSTQPLTLNNLMWQGDINGLLDLMASRSGLYWRMDNGRIVFYLTETRTYPLHMLNTKTSSSSSVSSGSTSTMGATGGQDNSASGDATSSQSTTVGQEYEATGNAAKFSGSSLLIKALSEQGDVSVVTSQESTVTNLTPVPIQMADQTVYVAQSATTTTTDVGATTTLTPGMITTGFNMTLLPLIQKTGNLQLQMNFNLSDPPTIRSFTSKDGNSYIEMPYTKLRSLSQKVNLKEGQSLVVTGFDQNNTTTSKAGTFTPANPLFGGSQTGKNERSTLVIIITPTFPSGGNNG